MLLVGTAQIAAKATRDSQGVAVVTLKKNQTIASVVPADTLELANPHRYRVRSLPATGALHPRRGRGRADEPAVKNFPQSRIRSTAPSRMGPLAWRKASG